MIKSLYWFDLRTNEQDLALMLAIFRFSVAFVRGTAKPQCYSCRDFQTGQRSLRDDSNSVKHHEVLTFENTRCYTQTNVSKVVSREVPAFIRAPDYATNGGIVSPSPSHIMIKTSKDIEIMKRAGEMARQMLRFAGSLIRVRYGE